MIPLTTWMRRALFATAVMNTLGAGLFLPAAESLRVVAGLPAGGQQFYLLLDSMFVLLFGLGYLWAAVAGRAERLFIGVAAVGKLSFFALLVVFWVMGALSIRAMMLGIGDLLFGILFVVWLLTARVSHS